ncbi:MAG: FAD:protein FMN transferase [Solirubrobacteraceae bacterium]
MLLSRHSFRAMGSPCELHLYGETRAFCDVLTELAVAEVRRLEQKYSRYRDDSVTSAINRSAGNPAGVAVDDETARLLDYAATAFTSSDGLFDPTSGVLRRVWNLKSGRVPEPNEIAAVLGLVGWSRVRWESPRLILPRAGMELDFGGFVKEYAADCVAELCRARGARHGMVDLGGDLAAIGPHPDGTPWVVGIRDPRAPQGAMASVRLHAGGVATSGDYERCMIVDGVRYTHVLDPRTGWPVTGLRSVSVVAERCLIAGTATTIAMLKGARDGSRWLDELGLPNLRMDDEGEISGTLAASEAEAA